MSSGSSREVSAVDPTRSQNITVSWRRSPLSARGASDVVAPVSPVGLPQPPQNFDASSFSKPHAGQGDGSGDPHSAQKRLVAAFSAVQFGQRIDAPWREPIRSEDTRKLMGLEARRCCRRLSGWRSRINGAGEFDE